MRVPSTNPATLAIFYFKNSSLYPQKIELHTTIIDDIGAAECYILFVGQNGVTVSLGIAQLPMEQGQPPAGRENVSTATRIRRVQKGPRRKSGDCQSESKLALLRHMTGCGLRDAALRTDHERLNHVQKAAGGAPAFP